MFLDTSLEDMGIEKVQQLRDRYRENTVSWVTSSAFSPQLDHWDKGNTSQWQQPDSTLTSFPFTVGDGGLGEPYVMSSMAHFHRLPGVTNFLPAGTATVRSITAWFLPSRMSG